MRYRKRAGILRDGNGAAGNCMVIIKSGVTVILALLGSSKVEATFVTAQAVAKFCRLAIVVLLPYCLLRDVPDFRM